MKTKLHISLLVFVISITTGVSQNYLGISKVITGFKDTVNVNQSVSYKVYIKNYGPGVFSGHFRVNTWVDSLGTSNTFHLSRTDTLLNPVTLQPGDSVMFNTGDTYDLATYRVGGNVVVIWPYTFNPGWHTQDSVFHDVYVRPPLLTNLSSRDFLKKDVVIYPNPFNDELFIHVLTSEEKIERVRIWDNYGRLLFDDVSTFVINTKEWSRGVYTIEITSPEARSIKRILKE